MWEAEEDANAALARKDWIEASTLAIERLKSSIDDGDAWMVLAKAQHSLGNHENYLNALRVIAGRRSPSELVAFGNHFLARNQREEAFHIFQFALILDPASIDARHGWRKVGKRKSF